MLAIPKSPDPRWQIARRRRRDRAAFTLAHVVDVRLRRDDVSVGHRILSSLERWQPQMLLVDLRMPGTDGLTRQSMLTEPGIKIPTVFLSGHGDVATSVRAIRAGALDFLEKPCDEPCAARSAERPMRRDDEVGGRGALTTELRARVGKLTRREREGLLLGRRGSAQQQIAAAWARPKTIKVHPRAS
jgi:FixJ family two-component response regulator